MGQIAPRSLPRITPDKPAFIFEGPDWDDRFTFGEWCDRAREIAAGLQRLGVGAGTSLVWHLPAARSIRWCRSPAATSEPCCSRSTFATARRVRPHPAYRTPAGGVRFDSATQDRVRVAAAGGAGYPRRRGTGGTVREHTGLIEFASLEVCKTGWGDQRVRRGSPSGDEDWLSFLDAARSTELSEVTCAGPIRHCCSSPRAPPRPQGSPARTPQLSR